MPLDDVRKRKLNFHRSDGRKLNFHGPGQVLGADFSVPTEDSHTLVAALQRDHGTLRELAEYTRRRGWERPGMCVHGLTVATCPVCNPPLIHVGRRDEETGGARCGSPVTDEARLLRGSESAGATCRQCLEALCSSCRQWPCNCDIPF